MPAGIRTQAGHSLPLLFNDDMFTMTSHKAKNAKAAFSPSSILAQGSSCWQTIRSGLSDYNNMHLILLPTSATSTLCL